MIRWLGARRWRQLLLTVVAALIFVTAAVTVIQNRNRSRVDISFSGALSGRMTATTSDTHCTVVKVAGGDQWDATFAGKVGGKSTELIIALTSYQGSGSYVSPGFPDAATLSEPAAIEELYRLQASVHIAVSRVPPRDYATPDYATDPFPPSRPTTLDQLKGLTGLGRAVVKLERDQMSGSIEATLMNAKTPNAPPVRLRGTFFCGKVFRGTASARESRMGGT